MFHQKSLPYPAIQDVLGGFASNLVAMTAAIAFGLSIYAPLGPSFLAMAALSGILGTVAIGLTAPLFGGTPRLISAPCAPAAAVLSVLVLELLKSGVEKHQIPVILMLTTLVAGFFQIGIGLLGGGRLIKFIPYPVIAGYLSGLGILITTKQLPKALGHSFTQFSFDELALISICISLGTVLVMSWAIYKSTQIPPALLGLFAGIVIYFCFSTFFPFLLTTKDNPFVVGKILPEQESILGSIRSKWLYLDDLGFSYISKIIVPGITLGFLLSVDTLKSCLVIDAMTLGRHESNRELIGQGIGNFSSSLLGGVAGAGTLGPTLVNLSSGAKTRISGFFSGVFALICLLFFTDFLSWLPIPALAGVLLVLGFRMIDWKSFGLLKNDSTVLDFFVILSVIISAVSTSLILAAGVGILMAIVLFLRDQVKSSVIRRRFVGSNKFSKKKRLPSEYEIIEKYGHNTVLLELQGQLFFGTTDQLFNVVEEDLKHADVIILDFLRVKSIDFTAVNLLKQIHSRILKRDGSLILTSLPTSLSTGHDTMKYLSNLGLHHDTPHLYFFPESDSALEWSEDQILKRNSSPNRNLEKVLDLPDFEFFSSFPISFTKKLQKAMQTIEAKSGDLVFQEGSRDNSVYFIRKGTVKIELRLSDGRSHHLATFSSGDFFGDLAFLDREPRSADALVTEDAFLYYLDRESFQSFIKKEPEASALFYEKLALVISHRLRLNLSELTALQAS